MNGDLVELLTQVLAWIILAGFVGFVVWGITAAFRPASAAPAPPDDPRTYVGTALAAVVAGVVAAAFGQQSVATGLSSLSFLVEKTLLIEIYAFVYFGAGVAALATWFWRKGYTPVLIRTIASSFFGLAIAVVPAYLKLPAVFGH